MSDTQFKLFYGGVFSQWHICYFEVDGIKYNCTEQYMMRQKALLFDDTETAEKIMQAVHPRDQKSLGRQVLNKQNQEWTSDDIALWNSKARDIVYKGNWHKFNQNSRLKDELLSYKTEEFVEASLYDRIWGICLDEGDKRALDKSQWKGTNWLGEVLSKVRDDLTVGTYRTENFNWSNANGN